MGWFRQRQQPGVDPGLLAASGWLLADAVGSALLFAFKQPERYTREWEQPGEWRTTRECPSGLSVEVGADHFPIPPSGPMPPDASARLGAAMRTNAEDISFRLAAQSGHWRGPSDAPLQVLLSDHP